MAVNMACYKFSAVVVWLVFYYFFVCKYCIEIQPLCGLYIFFFKLLSLKSALVYSDLIRYLVIPLGV